MSVCNNILSIFSTAECREIEKYVYVKVKADDYVRLAEFLKSNGFDRLLTVSAVDWIDKKVFEIYFLAYSFKDNIYIKVSTNIPRDKPEIESLSTVWENAAMHEREAWELFGIVFKGNKMLKPLFLEDWKELPPFRKDFDWRKYVAKEFSLKYPSTPRLIPPKRR